MFGLYFFGVFILWIIYHGLVVLPREDREAEKRSALGSLKQMEITALELLYMCPPAPKPKGDYSVPSGTSGGLPTVSGLHFQFEPTALVFGTNQPNGFTDGDCDRPYRGQESAKRRINMRLYGLGAEGRAKFLITSPAGTGKTALAWIIADRLRMTREMEGLPGGRFFELLPNQISDKAQLDDFMQQLQPFDTVFVDEIHVLCTQIGVESLYPVLADTGMPRYPLGSGAGAQVRMLPIPPNVSWLAATTEPGALDGTNGGALRRRFTEIALEPPTQDDLVAILQDQPLPIHTEAAYDISERSGGLPWQLLAVYDEARSFALYQGDEQITSFHTQQAFEILGLDEHGLFPEDRRVLDTLFAVRHTLGNGRVVHRMGESALLSAAGIDRNTYQTRIQPKLMRNSLLVTSGGQTLTDRAIALYGAESD